MNKIVWKGMEKYNGKICPGGKTRSLTKLIEEAVTNHFMQRRKQKNGEGFRNLCCAY